MAAKKQPSRPLPPGKTEKKVSSTGARVSSRYGKLESVGNPGAGVFQRKNVVSDFIRGAKVKKKK